MSNGRYAGIRTDAIEDEHGPKVIYLRRRFLPSSDEIAGRRTVEATAMRDRLDLVAASALGDAFAYWRICDANDAMNPFDLVAECQGQLRIPSDIVS